MCAWICGRPSQRPRDRLFSHFCSQKALRGKAVTKEASLYLVISADSLAILLTASRQFSWLDVSVSTAACCQSWSACTSDNICAIKLHLRLGICRTLPKARKQSDGEGHSRRYCHVRVSSAIHDTGYCHIQPRPVCLPSSCVRSANNEHSRRSPCVLASVHLANMTHVRPAKESNQR